jgi:WD40 repeat protein
MPNIQEIAFYSQLLNGQIEEANSNNIPLIKVIQKGALLSLAEDGSEDAVVLVSSFIAQRQDQQMIQLGLKILEHLAIMGNTASKNAICQLVIQYNLAPARQIVLDRQFTPDDSSSKAAFLILTGQLDKFNQADADYRLLTSFYLSSEGNIRKRLMASTRQAGLEELGQVLFALQNPTDETLSVIIDRFANFKSPKIKNLVIDGFSTLSERGSQPSQEALCQLFIRNENPLCLSILLEKGYLPSSPDQRALFYLLSSQMSKYEELDFDRSLLASIYGSLEKPIRARIMTQVQKNGHSDWIKAITGNSRMRFVNDLTDADWDSAISFLKEKGDWVDLWKLAQISPPIWSAIILDWLYEYQPPLSPEDYQAFSRLADLARTCLSHPPMVSRTKTLSGHVLEVTCLASDASKNILVSGSADQSIRVWDFDSGDLINFVSYPGRQIRTLAVSPDGKQVAVSTDDHNIQIINLADNRFVKSFQGHTSTVKCIAITSDGWFLASGSFDRSIRLWRFPFGPELKTITGGISEVFCLAISTDRKYMFSGGADHIVRIWSIPDGSAHEVMEGHTDTITSVAASPDGLYLASSSRDHTIRIWNLSNGSIHNDPLPHNSLATCMVFTPDSHNIVSGHLDGSIHLWNVSTGSTLLVIPAHEGPVTGLVINQDGTVLASSSNDQKIHFWDISSILQTHTPIDRFAPQSIHRIQEWSKDKRVSATNRLWLQFSIELYQFRRRYDIEIAEPEVIRTGNFDIEL